MKVTVTAGTSTFKIAGRSMVSDGVQWHGRLLNSLVLSRTFSQAGSAPAVLNISVKNNDFFIPKTLNLWAADVLIEADSGLSWSGKVTAYDSDGPGVLYLVATEKAAPELTIQVPDEVARLVTVDENFHVSALNVTLPLVIGGNSSAPILIKGILIDKVNGIHLLCVGEIHQVVKVYRGTEEITEGFSVFTGTSAQADYKGFAYVHITDEALRKNDDGSYASISAEVIGLKLGGHTVEECRNGARFLQYFLTTAKDGIGGWGLGIDSGDLDTTAFSAAVSRVDTAGLKLDGIFYFRQQAQSWIDQICHAIRGTYEISASGKRRVFVNATDTSVFTYNPSNMKLLRDGKGAYTGQVFNKGKLDYDYNPLTGQFMNFATYQNSTSIADIEEQDFYGQSYLIKDATTAQAILEYTCKRSLIGAEKVYFETDTLPVAGIKIGDVITVDYPEKSLSGTWQITGLQIGDFVHTIEAEKFDSSIFSVGTPGTAIDWPQDAPVTPSVVPGVASGLSLSSEVRPSPDGTNIVVIKGTFTPPAGAYIAASIEWGEGILPILTWNSLGMVQGNSFEIAPVKPAQAYAVRIRMVTATGKSSYTTGTLTTEGDTVPPGKPAIAATSSLKNVKISLSLGTVPSDMAGFEIYRNTSNNSGSATKVGTISSKTGEAQFVDMAENYGDQYYYWCKAFDTWGNPSVFSDAFGPLTISMVLNADVSPEAIKQAFGSVASWSAKNCTTASIAEVGGVRDVSGNANHGQAFVGVAVVDTEMGKAFRQSALKCIAIPGTGLNAVNRTFSCWIKKTNSTNAYAQILAQNTTANSGGSLGIIGLWTNSSGAIVLYVTDGVAYRQVNGLVPTPNRFYHVVGVIEGNVSLKLYIDGAIASSATIAINPRIDDLRVFIGGYSSTPEFDCFDPRVYNRALSATEVKSLYMFPGDVAFGRITSDLVTTGQLITLSAQIAEALINDAHINNLHAAKLTAGIIDVARLGAASITADKILVGKAGASLNDDPNFEDASAWGAHPTYPSYYTSNIVTLTDGAVGNKAMRSNGYSIFAGARLIPIDVTKSYIQRVQARRSSTATGPLYIAFACYDGNKNYINLVYSFSGGTLTTSWVQKVGVVVGAGGIAFPSGTKFIRPYLLLNYHGTAGTYHEVQDFRTEEVVGGTLIQDGAITTVKLTTDAIKSLNYSTTAGSFLNLADGKFIVGGSANPVFTVDAAAKTGKIAGFSFNTTDLTAGSSTTAIGISTDTAKRAFWAGSTTPSSAPFNVTHAGAVTATSGSIGGFTLASNRLSVVHTIGANETIETGLNSTDKLVGTKRTYYVNASNHTTHTTSFSSGYLGCAYDSTVAGVNTFNVMLMMPNLGSSYSSAMLTADMASAGYWAISTNGKIRGIIDNISDENIKSNFKTVDTLEKLRSIPILEWEYDDERARRTEYERLVEQKLKESNTIILNDSIAESSGEDCFMPKERHIGHMAGAFNAAFGVNGENKESYLIGDAIGVALRAIQELAEIVDEQKAEIAELRAALKLPENQKEQTDAAELTAEEIEKAADGHVKAAYDSIMQEYKKK